VNVVGSFIAAQEAVKRLQRNGRIINIASRAFLAGRAHAAYTASKSAVVGLTRAMAVDLASRGIYVNCIAPGLIETEMFRSLTADRQKELIALQPTNTVGQPEDIANAVAFFASPRTQYLTGQVMIVDGGRSLGVSTY
jgi:3-oxoacyl-[acyl-carrier protein] reductase